MPLSDEQLVIRYRNQGDERALEELIHRYTAAMYGFIRHYTGNAETAEDITQEVFVKMWKHLKDFDVRRPFRAWIYTIAKRTAIDWMKKRHAIPFSALDTDEQEWSTSVPDETPSILEQLSMRSAGREVAFAMAQVPDGTRRVIELHVNDEFSFREIARKVSTPLNTVKSQYRRGIALLKRVLSATERE